MGLSQEKKTGQEIMDEALELGDLKSRLGILEKVVEEIAKHLSELSAASDVEYRAMRLRITAVEKRRSEHRQDW